MLAPALRLWDQSCVLKTEPQHPIPFVFQKQYGEETSRHLPLLVVPNESSIHSFRRLPRPYQLLAWLLLSSCDLSLGYSRRGGH